MLAWLKKAYRREQFFPSLFGALINPFYFPRKYLLDNLKSIAPTITGRLLDIGCGKKPYRELFNCSEYLGLEIDTEENRLGKNADLFYNGKNIPCGPGEFDAVFMSQVLEHVFEPEALLADIHRVLKSGGKLLITVPFAWDEHEQPWDYARYSSFGLKHLVGKFGFEIIESHKSGANIAAVFQMLNNYLYKTWVSRGTLRYFLLTPILIGPLNLIGLLLSRLLPGNDDFYLDNILLARKK